MSRQPAGNAYASHGREASKVDADADGDLPRLGLAHHKLDLFPIPDIARVEPEAVDAALQRPQRQLIVEVDVSDDWDAHLSLDFGERLRRLHVWHRAPDDIDANLLDLSDLVDGGSNVSRVGLGHGLDGNLGVASDLDLTDVDRTWLLRRFFMNRLPDTAQLRTRSEGTGRGALGRNRRSHPLPSTLSNQPPPVSNWEGGFSVYSLP